MSAGRGATMAPAPALLAASVHELWAMALPSARPSPEGLTWRKRRQNAAAMARVAHAARSART